MATVDAGIDDEPAITLREDVSFSDFGLTDPSKIESDDALRDHRQQVELLILQELSRVSARQRAQDKRITGHNGDISGVEEKVQEIKHTQDNCLFSNISSWITLTAKGGGAVAAAAGGGYAIARLIEHFVIL